MKRVLIHILDIILFICVLGLILMQLSYVMLRKETLVRFAGFFKNPKQYDVLIVGDSHTVIPALVISISAKPSNYARVKILTLS